MSASHVNEELRVEDIYHANNDNGEELFAASNARSVAKKDQHDYPPEIIEKAKEISFFQVDPPANVTDGMSAGEYNLIKGTLSAATILVVCPFLQAYEEAARGKTYTEQATGVVTGFSSGLVRGVAGATVLVTTGAITGLNQIRIGLQDAPDAPGQGRGMKENWEHIINTPYTQIVQNVEPESFQAELEQLIAEGKLPAKRFDVEGREIPYTYQFFHTEEPSDFYDGLQSCQYNVGKGLIAGTALAVSAPFLDCIEKFNETDEKGQIGGFEGAVKGLGQGVFRGGVGGAILISGGLAYGTAQLLKGFVSLHNIPKGALLAEQIAKDYERVTREPILNMMLQKGYGLEEFLIKEEERIRMEEEEKARVAEEKRVWYEEHPGEVHPADYVAPPEPVSTEPDFFTSSLNAISSISIPLPSSSFFFGEEKKAAAAGEPENEKPASPSAAAAAAGDEEQQAHDQKEPILLVKVEDAAARQQSSSPEVHGH